MSPPLNMPVPPEGVLHAPILGIEPGVDRCFGPRFGLVAHHYAGAVGPFVVPLGRAGRRHARSCGLIASGNSDLLSPSVRWRIARILVDREARVSAVVTVLSRSRRGDFGFDFASGRGGLPDDLKPPIIAGPNAVIDRRRLAIGDHFLSGALGVVARREA